MAAARDALQAEINRVVEGGVLLRSDERQLLQDRVAVRVLSSSSWARLLKPIRKYSSFGWLVLIKRERAFRAFCIFSPLIEPETSKSIPSETGASVSLKNVISCSWLLSRTVKEFFQGP